MSILVSETRDRLTLALVAITAAGASLAETLVLVVLSVAGLRLAGDDTAGVELPFAISPDSYTTAELVVAGFVLVGLRLLVLVGNAYLVTALSAGVSYRWRARAVNGFLGASYSRVLQTPDGQLQTVVQTHVERARDAANTVARALTSAISLAVFLVAALAVNAVAALGLLLFGGLLFVLLRPMARLSSRFSRQQSEVSNEYALLLSQATATVREQRTFGVAREVAAGLDQSLTTLTETDRKRVLVMLVSPQAYVAMGFLAILVGFAIAVRLEVEGVAAIGAITLLMIRSLGHGQGLQASWQKLAGAEGFLEDMVAAVGEFESEKAASGEERLGAIERLDLVDATIGYGTSVILRNVNVSLSQGDSVGVIGPSGAGKSTLVSTLLGLLPTIDGSYQVNGLPVEEIDATDWTRRVSYVPQEATLIAGSVRDNIRFYRPDLRDQAVVQAANTAHLGRETQVWPSGLDFDVGPSGNRLSGGQRQRVCIARALAGDPDLLVLDEPTSALDQEAEFAVASVLAELSQQRSLVVVAHRLSTLRFCERVLLVDGERVVEIGSGIDIQDSEELRQMMSQAAESADRDVLDSADGC